MHYITKISGQIHRLWPVNGVVSRNYSTRIVTDSLRHKEAPLDKAPSPSTFSQMATIQSKGLLNLPGITPASKSLTENLLLRDAEKHHCYFRASGFHNHLCHHVLAAYDMGAAPGLIQKIYDQHAAYQRPIYVEEKDMEITVSKQNWTEYLGKQEAYGAFFKFFYQEVEKLGTTSTLEEYVFRPEANIDGRCMLHRFVSGAVHPLIQVGYGAEFRSNTLIATGLAQTAIHKPAAADLFPSAASNSSVINPIGNDPSPSGQRQPSSSHGPSLLEILRQVCDSEVLAPPLPYNPDLLLSERIRMATEGPKSAEIRRLCEQYTLSIPDDASEVELQTRVEEIVWAATLLMVATGREGREHRLDFFLMHLVTSSLFLEPLLATLKETKWKVQLIRHYIPIMVVIMLSRGRPVIRATLVQDWSATPRPPAWREVLGFGNQDNNNNNSGLGKLQDDKDYNPWPVLIQAALHHPDMHNIKAMRTLVYAAQKYGDVPVGGVIGAFRPTKAGGGSSAEQPREETFAGMAKLDGTLFVRAAGVMMDYMRWTVCGQPGREDWDRSALGWDGAWANKN